MCGMTLFAEEFLFEQVQPSLIFHKKPSTFDSVQRFRNYPTAREDEKVEVGRQLIPTYI